MDFGTDCFHTVLDFIFATAGEQKKKKTDRRALFETPS